MSVVGLTGTKTWSTTILHGDGPSSRTTIRINNPNSYPVTNLTYTDTFPTTMQLTTVPNVVSTCGGTVTAVSLGLTLSLSGGTIPANSFCTVSADLIARNSASSPSNSSQTNRLSANTVTTTQGATNAANINGAITVQKGAAVSKSFTPSGIQAGGTSTLLLTLQNFNATAISGYNFTDAMPAGVTVTGPVASTCGGTASFTSSAVTVTGGSLAAAPVAAGSTNCTLSVPVTAATSGNYVNSVPAGTLAGISYASATATLQVSAVTGSKAFTLTSLPQTGATTLTITLNNRNTTTAAAITSFTDNLNTMGTGITIASTPAASNTCGGTLTATPGTTLISMSGGSIPRASSATVLGACTITVPVVVSNTATTGTRTNTVAANALVTSLGNNAAAFTAALTVAAPVTVAKSSAPATVVGGTVTRTTITITRTANAALFTGMALTDALPSGFTIAPVPNAVTTCTGGTVSAPAGGTTIALSGASLGTVVTSSASCTIAVNLLAPTTNGSYTNTIAVGGVAATTSSGSVSNLTAASAVMTVISGVTLNKSFSPTSVLPGGISRVTVYISNPASAGISLTGVALTDTLPSGLVLASPPNLSFTATSGSCTGTLTGLAGATNFKVSAGSITTGSACELAADVTTASIGSLTNTLPPNSLTSTQGQTNSNTASATLISSGSADVSVTKTDSSPDFVAGATNTYAMVITNNSTALAVSGLPVTDPEPSGLSLTAWTCTASPGSSCATATGSGPIASTVTLAPLGTATLSATATLASGYPDPTITNVITVDPAAAGVFDPVSTNNSASDTDNVVRRADVKVTKAVSNPSPRIGDDVTFTITVENIGPSDAASVEVTDALPAGYTLVGVTPSVGSYTAPTWTVGPLIKGEIQTLTIVAEVNPTGPYANSATVTSPTTDPNTANNSATVTPLTIGLDMVKVSTILSDPVNGTTNPKAIPGAIIQYDVTLSNSGTAAIDADTMVIEDMLPAELAPYVATGSGAPVTMTDLTAPSGLTFAYASHVQWSDQVDGGPPYSHTPAPDADGYDAAATGIRIAPVGSFSAGSVAAPKVVRFTYRGRIQ